MKRELPVFAQHFTHDFDEQASFLRGWQQDYAQISMGEFTGSINECHWGDLSVFWEYTSHTLEQRGCIDADVVAMGVPLGVIDQGFFCGVPCSAQTVHLYSGSSGFEFISPKSLTMGLLVLNRTRLMAPLSAEDQHFLNMQSQYSGVLPVSAVAFKTLVTFFHSVAQLLLCPPEATELLRLREFLVMQITDVVVEILLNRVQSPPEPHKTWQVVRDVRALIHERQGQPVNVSQLCEHLEMSRRSLQYHFEQALHMNPLAYLRAERLNGVHRMLQTANSVTEAATHWGFWHFGHFSQAYKEMFGEMPSTTFKRYRN